MAFTLNNAKRAAAGLMEIIHELKKIVAIILFII